ncbi:ComEC/Rec2 family competence protein [Hyalangium rubrum]|uniref:MBL fold metallo-hydrolase n=1 Tax=Hyalangium rubrum TaxID=3103134 RepID=A0ABU5H8Z2_9BACT|nr:MBL fold metallo-hydrolase [Hyalangium sp. s54d21]MDY7229318.1 MBL fold metallo-hydrolase [Hyalangium sp. s54d21]
MFAIEMLPADHGDCLVISYGNERRPNRILIDAGTPSTFKRLQQYIEKLPARQRSFELLIVTHIDSDHIGGVLPLLRANLGLTFGDIWFNAWHHLTPPVRRFLGPQQGDLLGNLLSQRPDLPWNKAFGGDTVVIPDTGALPSVELAGGMTLTLLSPRWKELENLEKSWTDQAFRAGRIPGELPMLAASAPGAMELLGGSSRIEQLAAARFFPDAAVANGSSIAVLAEYEGKRALLTGDAFAPVLTESIQRLPGFEKRLTVNAVKLPHHGSESNVSRELLHVLKSNRYLVSTNGKIFKHPDEVAIARVLEEGGGSARIFFNYKSLTTLPWKTKRIAKRSARGSPFIYPERDEEGILVRL